MTIKVSTSHVRLGIYEMQFYQLYLPRIQISRPFFGLLPINVEGQEVSLNHSLVILFSRVAGNSPGNSDDHDLLLQLPSRFVPVGEDNVVFA
jgi:hypothetical protein